MAYTHTVYPGYVPDGYFDDDNVQFLRRKIADVLSNSYVQTVLIDVASIKRLMLRVLEERLEPVPKMNQRVVMYATNEVWNHQGQMHKHMKWEEHFQQSQAYYDPTVESLRFDGAKIKLANRLGNPRIGNARQFVFL